MCGIDGVFMAALSDHPYHSYEPSIILRHLLDGNVRPGFSKDNSVVGHLWWLGSWAVRNELSIARARFGC